MSMRRSKFRVKKCCGDSFEAARYFGEGIGHEIVDLR
jgi:hypothetical protein